MKLTRRQAVVGAVAGAVGAGGIYELVDQLTGGTPRRADAAAPFREQHLLDGIRVVQLERDRGARAAAPSRGGDGACDGFGERRAARAE